MAGSIHITGIGPGTHEWLAPEAERALLNADVILGYHTYLEQITTIVPHTRREGSGMHHEIERAKRAIELAVGGENVALVSGGDAGIYGMAGLVYELLENRTGHAIAVEVLPGISALNAAAALLGAPLMTDFVAISLSDYLIPLETILTRVKAAIQGDFVICFYNPRSHRRTQPYERAFKLCLESLGEDRPVGVVRSAYRKDQQVMCTTLKDLPALEIGMDCILIIGNRTTRIIDGKMVTRRGYPVDPAAREEP